MSRIDPSIALNVKTPQPNDALETYGRVLQMRNLLDAGKINKQNIEMNDENLRRAGLQNEALERTQKGQQIQNDAVRANTNLNEDGTVHVNHDMVEAVLTRYGYPDFAKKYNEDRSAIEENEHKRVMNQLEEHSKKTKQLGQMSQSILNAAPDLRPGLYSFALKQAQSANLMTPDELKQLPQQYDDQTAALLQQMSDHAQEDPAGAMIKRMQEKRASDEAAAKLPGEKAEALQKQIGVESTILGNATDQAGWTKGLAQLPDDRRGQYAAQYTPEAAKQAALMGLTPEQRQKINEASSVNDLALKAIKGDKDAQKALDFLKKREIDIDSAKQLGGLGSTFNSGPGGGPTKVPVSVLDTTGEDFLKSIPEGARGVVKGLTDYSIPLPGGMALKTGYWIKMLELAKQYDPAFDVKEYLPRQKLLSSFKSGEDANNIKSINTAIAHIDRLAKATDELNNYKDDALGVFTTAGNWLANAAKSAKGAPVVTRYRVARSAVKSELTRAFRGTGGSVDDVKDWETNFSMDSSIDAQKDAGKEAISLLAGRLKSVRDKYETGMGKPRAASILTPESREIIKNLGIDPNTIEPETPVADAPKKGDTQQHLGFTYIFDGTQWVKQQK